MGFCPPDVETAVEDSMKFSLSDSPYVEDTFHRKGMKNISKLLVFVPYFPLNDEKFTVQPRRNPRHRTRNGTRRSKTRQSIQGSA